MNTSNQITAAISSGGNLCDITDGKLRLSLALDGFKSIAQSGITLSHELDSQFTKFSNPARVADLYSDYQTNINEFSSLARQANQIMSQATKAGSLNLDQTQKMENLSQKANKVLKKLKDIKQELIRRRLEGDDEFDGRGGAAPMLLIACC